MTPDEELVQTATDLADSVRDFQNKLGLSTALEERTSTTEKDVSRGKRWIRLTIIGLAIDVILSLGLGAVAFKAQDSSRTAAATERQLCAATQRSWDTRDSLVTILTKPTTLSPQIEQLFPSGQIESLKLQVAASNHNKKIQFEELKRSNGPRPSCS